MRSPFLGAVPEIPVRDINEAAAYYENNLGFTVDWTGEALGLAGISKGTAGYFWRAQTIESNTATLGQC
jgi:hypothetical protein